MNILAHVQPYIQDQKTGLMKNTFLTTKKFCNSQTQQKKFKRNTERMPFEVTCTAWKALFQEKENKKKEELAILERKNKKKEKKEMK